MEQQPVLCIIGSVPDDFNMIPAIASNYDPVRQRGGIWTLGFEWGKAHKVANALSLFVAWFQAIDRISFDDAGQRQPIPADSGWRGLRTDWESSLPSIAVPGDLTEEQEQAAVWLPDQAFAHTWRSYQSTGSPWEISAMVGDKMVQKAFAKADRRQAVLSQGEALTLTVQAVDAENDSPTQLPDQVTWHHGVEELSLSDGAWTPPGPGCYVIHAQWQADGNQGVTRPMLVVVKQDAPIMTLKVDPGATELPHRLSDQRRSTTWRSDHPGMEA